MKWKDVKNQFSKDFTSEYCTIEDNSDMSDEIKKYKTIFNDNTNLFLSHFNGGTAKERSARSRVEENTATLNILTKRSSRTDKGSPHTWKNQAAFTEKYIQEQWEMGDPEIRESVAEALRVYVIDFPEEDSTDKYSNKMFKEKILAYRKKTSLSQFITCCMNRIGFSTRKCCIG